MDTLIETDLNRPESAVLVGIAVDSRRRLEEEESLQELEELTRSAGATVVARILQEKRKPDPAYLIGRGKLEEVRTIVENRDADFVVFDQELSPAQLRNVEAVLEVKVIDRTELILDIFAQRAQSREGKLQVELAQLEYLLPRLTGKGIALSRLGGGIGTRGPGETKLEVDRRAIRRRISKIKGELEHLEQRRALHRSRRRGIPVPTVSLVGYTNAGKSTLFNRLTDAGTYASARMFATLDPLVRRLRLPSGQEVLLSDTVGFIRKLPHTLVAAFHATLEETLQADLILHVIDVSHPSFEVLRSAVYEVLEEIGFREKPVLEVYNKIDLLSHEVFPLTSQAWVEVSARTGKGIDELLEKLEESINAGLRPVELKIPYQRGELVAYLRERASVENQEAEPDGFRMLVLLSAADRERFSEFVVQPEHRATSRQGVV